MFGQRTAETWVAEMASKHKFQILTGVYPTYMHDSDDLAQAIREVQILRDGMFERLCADESLSATERALRVLHLDKIVERLRQLQDEPECEAYFG